MFHRRDSRPLRDAYKHMRLTWQRIQSGLQFRREFSQFVREADDRYALRWEDRYPCLSGDEVNAMPPRDYLLHVGWAARQIAASLPEEHVDISSSAYFIAAISAFVKTTYYEFRPWPLPLNNLTTLHADLLSLPMMSNSVRSLSCMHVVEHIGLGRYGDPIDPQADVKSMRELERVTAPGGRLLFVCPVGRPRIQFNAHRILGYRQVVEAFGKMDLISVALVEDDQKKLIVNAPESQFDRQAYGCGCFAFVKRSA